MCLITRFADAVKEIEEAIKKEGYEFMHNAHLGYIRACPTNLGTGLREPARRPAVRLTKPSLATRAGDRYIRPALYGLVGSHLCASSATTVLRSTRSRTPS